MKTTIKTEDKYAVPFFNKIQIAIERGQGVYVWDEDGRKYIDFTSGWGVTCIGHANSAITKAIEEQSHKILQNPSSGLTYSPIRAKLLELLVAQLPDSLTRVFFSNSGAEANDAVIKLARKVSSRLDVIATEKSFHGRTISTASATGQAKHREKFNPLMPNYRFVPYNDLDAMKRELDDRVAAVILEPIQGEGGVNLPKPGYLETVSELCRKNGTFLIMDEVQTGFCRTGPMFASSSHDMRVDFLTMAKGIGGGFPIGAFAMSEEIALKIEIGDHGGTYCGNPLGCAVAYAVINYLITNKISDHSEKMGAFFVTQLNKMKDSYPGQIKEVRGKGLLVALELQSVDVATKMYEIAFEKGLFINLTQGTIIRIFPALNITEDEATEGLQLLEQAFQAANK